MESRIFVSKKQEILFKAIEKSGKLIFACGKEGVSANLVGNFKVRKNSRSDDQLNVDDGTHHVHIDWNTIHHVKIGTHHSEGILTFYNNHNESLFKLYRIEGPFEDHFKNLCGVLI